MAKLKQTKNLFKKLIKDEESVFYTVERISRSLLRKAKKTLYGEDTVFYKYYLDLEYKNVLYESKDPKKSIPFTVRLLGRERTLIGHLPYTVSRFPSNLCMMILLIFNFFYKSAVDAKYCLLVVDLFTSKTYTYHIKKRHLLVQKMELFYHNIQQKKQQVRKNESMRLQVDLEFQKNEIKRLNEKDIVKMFSSGLRGRKTYAAE